MVLRFLGVLLALLMTQGFTEEQSQHFSANRTAIRDLYSEMTTFDPLISTKCNPDSGSCKCLESWGVDGACYKLQTRFRATNATRPSVTIEVGAAKASGAAASMAPTVDSWNGRGVA